MTVVQQSFHMIQCVISDLGALYSGLNLSFQFRETDFM